MIGIGEPLLHRTIEVNDCIGARLLLSKLIQNVMEMCFLQSKRYWPYDKWFGTAFSDLSGNEQIITLITSILNTANIKEQLPYLQKLMILIGEKHNELHVTTYVEPKYADFRVGIDHAVRPYPVFNAGDFKDSCLGNISERSLGEMMWVGSIDQLTHSNDALINFTDWPDKIEQIYRANLNKT